MVDSNGKSKKNVKTATGRKKRIYPFKKKIAGTLLFSLVAPLMLCFFCPFEIYAANIGEFTFSLMDFLPLCILAAVVLAGALFALLMLLDGIAYEVGCGVMLWLSLMFFLQRNFLNMGINALVGDGVGTSDVGVGAAIVGLLVWLAVGAGIICAVVFFRKKHIDTALTVVAVAMVALLGSQIVSFAVLSFTTDVYTPVTDRMTQTDSGKIKVLTYDSITELSDGKNIVFFLVDRFDAKYFRRMQTQDPEFFARLDGFTYFDDYTSLYCRTYPAVASILTGKKHDFTNTKAKAFSEFYSDGGGHLGTLKKYGYDINIYTEKNYAYLDASVMDGYVDNTSGVEDYYIDSHIGLSWDMLRLSLSEYLPIAAKGWAGYMSTPDFNNHAKYDGDEVESGTNEGEISEEETHSVKESDEFVVDETGTSLLYDHLKSNKLSTVKGEGRFTFIHLYGCHDTTKTSVENVQNTFELIYYYIEQMKELGVYENATIIITGDHAAALSDSKLIGEANGNDDGTRVTAMLFKKSGDAGTELKTSSAQISQDELWATIFESEGLDSEKKGRSFFDIPEGEQRERRYLFEMYKNPKNNDLEYNRLIEYKITGTANDGDNWEIVKQTDIIK